MKRSILLFLALFLAFSSQLHAQNFFTGSFNVEFANVGDDSPDVLNIVVSPERMRIGGVKQIGAAGSAIPGLQPENLLVRMDMADFVMVVSETEAIQIRHAEIQAMFNLFRNMARGGQPAQQPQPAETQAERYEIRESRETRRIEGFSTKKIIVTDDENPGVVLHVWVSEQFHVNWGMIAEAVGQIPGAGDTSVFTELFRGGQTPLLVEAFDKDGNLDSTISITNVSRNADATLLEVPTGVRVMSLQEMMINRMRQY